MSPSTRTAAPEPATAEFRHEYDLEALERIRPRGCDFEMLVTPRYLGHFVANAYEAFATSLVGAASRRQRLFLDVGAHYGYFSLVAARRNPDLEILALEPVPATLDVLARNLELNGLTGAIALRRAVSDRPGRARFNVSLSSDNCGFYPHPFAPPIGEIEVETVTVDSLLGDREPCPAFVKVDTDGHELAVLAGMSETLERFADLTLLIELNPKMQRRAGHEPEEILVELDRLGFDAYLLDESRRRAYRVDRAAAWAELMPDPGSYVNLYCCRRETSTSVCFFSHSAGLAGAERSLLELVTELTEDHGAVCTVVLPVEGPLKRHLESAGAATLVTPYPWWCDTPYDPGGGEPRSKDFAERLAPAARALLDEPLRELRRIDPHVVVTHTLAIPWGAFLASVLERPHVWHVCEAGDLNDDLDFFLPFDDVVETVRSSSSYVFTAADGIRRRMFGDADASFCRTLYRHIVIPDRLGEAGQPSPYVRPGAVRLGVFGLYSPAKGQDLAVTAAAELIRRGRRLELVLAGAGRERYEEELGRLIQGFGIEGSVHLLDFVDDVYRVMRETDVVVVSSRTEAFSRVTVEAMLLGKPVVYPDHGGPAEYMRDGVTGLSYPAGDAGGMAEAIDRLVSDPGLRRELGARGREYARATFTREAYGGAAIQVLRRLREAAPRAAPAWTPLLAGALATARAETRALEARTAALEAELGSLREAAQASGAEIARLRAAETASEERRRALERELGEARRELTEARRERAEAHRILQAVLDGATWTVATALRKPFDLLAPAGSRRRQVLKGLVGRRGN